MTERSETITTDKAGGCCQGSALLELRARLVHLTEFDSRSCVASDSGLENHNFTS